MFVAFHYAFISKAQLAAVLTVLPILITKSAMASLRQRTMALRVLATLVWKFWMSVVVAVTTPPTVMAMWPISPPVQRNAGRKLIALILASRAGKHCDDWLA